MKPKIKIALSVAAIAFVGMLVTVTVIDQRQLRPLGQPLAPPEIVFKTDAKLPFDITDVEWVDANGVQLLTGTVVDLRQDGDTTPLPGAILDTQVPSRAERLRELGNRMAAESAVRMAAAGHQDLAAQVLMGSLSRGQKRQFIARMTDDGKIDIVASIENNLSLDFVTSPGGKRIVFGSGEFPEREANKGPSFYTAFISNDGGRTWKFDPKTTVPSSTEFHGYVSETRAYAFDHDRQVWTTFDGGRSWQNIDLSKTVWSDISEREHQIRDTKWALLSAPGDKAVGWSTMSLITVDDHGEEKSQQLVEARRFELDFSSSPVAVRNVTATPDAGPAHEQSYRVLQSDSRDALFAQPDGRLRYFDPTTGNWTTSAIPDIRGAAPWVDKVWLGSDGWVVHARGDTAWNIVACYMPPYFSHTRNCGYSSANAYFYSRDKGHSWVPFVLPRSPGEDDYMIQVIGWDTRRQGLLVLRNDPQNSGRKQVELYRLPAQQSGAKQDA